MKKKEKNWKNSLYKFSLLLKSLFRHSVIAHVRFVADDFMLTQARKNIIQIKLKIQLINTYADPQTAYRF